jgi:hypothetical protein
MRLTKREMFLRMAAYHLHLTIGDESFEGFNDICLTVLAIVRKAAAEKFVHCLLHQQRNNPVEGSSRYAVGLMRKN